MCVFVDKFPWNNACINEMTVVFSGASLESAYESVVSYMLDPSNVVEVNNRQFHIVEHSALHLVFKKLIQQDQAPGQLL